MARPRLRWIVGERDPGTLGGLLQRIGESSSLAAGRAFVDGRRTADPNQALRRGSAVEIFPPAAAHSAEIELLHRSDDLIWVSKPAGIPTEPDQRGAHSVVAVISERLALPGLHALSRLDTAVSGVVLLSASSEARRRVSELRARNALRRRYVAIAHSEKEVGSGVWRAAIGRAGGARRSLGGRGAQPAETRFFTVARAGAATLLALEPVTGRTHQLRVHAGAHGAPLYGDRLYGGPTRVTDAAGRVRELTRIALHAAWVILPHPGGEELRVGAEPPAELVSSWVELGGSASDFDLALADPPLVE